MNFTPKLIIFSVVSVNIIYVLSHSFDEDMEEWNQVCPGIDFPVKCPEKSKHFAKIYYEDDFLNVSDIYNKKEIEPLSDIGHYIIKNISVKDDNDFVCVYKEREIKPYTIHVMVIAGDPIEYLNHTEVYHFGVTLPPPGVVKEPESSWFGGAGSGLAQKERIIDLKDGSSAEVEDVVSNQLEQEEYLDEPRGMAHDQLGQDYGNYIVGPAVNTTGLVPPSVPTIKRESPSSVQVSWSIKLNKGSPVTHYVVQHLQSMSPHGVGGGNFWMDSKDISPSTKWCTIDKLTPKYYYRFRVAAVFHNKGQEIKVYGKRSKWLKLV